MWFISFEIREMVSVVVVDVYAIYYYNNVRNLKELTYTQNSKYIWICIKDRRVLTYSIHICIKDFTFDVGGLLGIFLLFCKCVDHCWFFALTNRRRSSRKTTVHSGW